MPSIFCILKFLLIQVYRLKIRHSHRFVAVVIQILFPLIGKDIAFVKDWQGLEKPVNDFKGMFSQF